MQNTLPEVHQQMAARLGNKGYLSTISVGIENSTKALLSEVDSVDQNLKIKLNVKSKMQN